MSKYLRCSSGGFPSFAAGEELTVRAASGAKGEPAVIDGEYDTNRVTAAIDALGFDAHDRQTHLVAAKRAAMIAGLA